MNIEFQTKWELFCDLGGGGETGTIIQKLYNPQKH